MMANTYLGIIIISVMLFPFSLAMLIVSFIFGSKLVAKSKKITIISLSLIASLFVFGGFICTVIGGVTMDPNVNGGNPLVWIALGLVCGAALLALISLIISIVFKINQKVPPKSKLSYTEELKQLKELHDSGAITDEEFAKAKEKILG